MRILGLDYGSKTVGAAVTDEIGMTACSLEIIRRDSEKRLRRTCARIEEIITEYNVGLIVLGLPLNMDGSEGTRAQKTREFSDMLQRRTGLEVILVDERLTTVEADEIIDLRGDRRFNRKEHIDSIAAAVILEDYLNRKK